jgi:hypothetical protein
MNHEGPRKRIVLCYTSCFKENKGIDILYGPLSLAYLARHTPENYELELVDEYVGENLDVRHVIADIVAFSSLSSGINRTYELADVLRGRGILTVLGGALCFGVACGGRTTCGCGHPWRGRGSVESFPGGLRKGKIPGGLQWEDGCITGCAGDTRQEVCASQLPLCFPDDIEGLSL